MLFVDHMNGILFEVLVWILSLNPNLQLNLHLPRYCLVFRLF